MFCPTYIDDLLLFIFHVKFSTKIIIFNFSNNRNKCTWCLIIKKKLEMLRMKINLWISLPSDLSNALSSIYFSHNLSFATTTTTTKPRKKPKLIGQLLQLTSFIFYLWKINESEMQSNQIFTSYHYNYTIKFSKQ